MLPWSLFLPHLFFEDEDADVPATFARSTKPASPRVAARVAALTTRPLILERKLPVTGGALLTSMVEHVCCALAGDVDAPYYLVYLAAQRALQLIRKMRAATVAVDAAITNLQQPGGNTTAVFGKINSILAGPASTPAERAQLVERLTAATTAYAASVRDQQGGVALGQHVSTSADDLLTALDGYALAALELSEFSGNFATCMDRYAALDLAAAPFRAQLATGAKALQGADAKPSEAAVDALILASMLRTRSRQTAPTGKKYSGPATPQQVGPASLTGVGSPFLPAADVPLGTASITVGATSGVVSVTAGEAPALHVLLPALVTSETGTLQHYTVAPNVRSALKAFVVPGSIRMTVTTPLGTYDVTDVQTAPDVGEFTDTYLTGAVRYSTGAIVVTATGSWPLPIVADIVTTYRYAPLGDLHIRTPFTDDITGTINTVRLFTGNMAIERTLVAPDGGVVSSAILDGLLVAAFASTALMVRALQGVLVATAAHSGSASVVACPAGTPAQLNPTFGGPTWAVVPTTLNEALGAVNTYAQGTDADASSVVVPTALQSVVTVGTVAPPLLQATATLTDATLLPVTAVLPAGATVRCTGYCVSRHRVVSCTADTATLYPAVPFTPGATQQDVSFVATAVALQVDALSTDSPIEVGTVTNGGLGLSGVAYPQPREIAHDWPDSSVVVRPGDLIVQGGTVVTDVAHARAGTVILNDPQQLQQPIGSLTIYSLGWTSHAALKIALGRIDTSALFDGSYVRAAARYGFSQIDQAAYVASEQQTLQTLDALERALARYQANRVASVDALLQYLREERFTGTIQALMNLDFANAINPDIAVLSSTIQADQLLGELTSVLQQSGDHVVTGAITQPNDFTDRPRDTQIGINGRVL